MLSSFSTFHIIKRTLAQCKTPEQREVIQILHGEIIRDWAEGKLGFDISDIMIRAFKDEQSEEKMHGNVKAS